MKLNWNVPYDEVFAIDKKYFNFWNAFHADDNDVWADDIFLNQAAEIELESESPNWASVQEKLELDDRENKLYVLLCITNHFFSVSICFVYFE